MSRESAVLGNYLCDCAECGVAVHEGENVELSSGTYCETCGPQQPGFHKEQYSGGGDGA